MKPDQTTFTDWSSGSQTLAYLELIVLSLQILYLSYFNDIDCYVNVNCIYNSTSQRGPQN